MGGIRFRGAAASSGTTPAQGRLVLQLLIRQLLGVRHVKSPYAHKGAQQWPSFAILQTVGNG